MRQIFSILAFILLSASVFAQSPNTPPILFSSRFQITNAVNGTGDTIVISGYTDDCTSRFSNSNIAIGDSLYVLEGTDLLIFGVVTTRTISLGIATFKVRDFNGAGLLPSNGQAAIFRPTTDYDFPGYVCGLNDGLQQYISDRFRQNLDAALSAGSTDSTIYATVYSRDTAAAAIRGEIAALAQPPFDSTDIATGGIGNTDLSTDAVTASKIAAGAVGASELASTAVTPGSYTNANITVDADGRVTAASSGSEVVGSSTIGGCQTGINQTTHGFTLLKPIYLNSSTWTAATAASETVLHDGIVVDSVDADSFVLAACGIATVTGHGYTVGADYFVTDAGGFSTTPGTINDLAFTVLDANTLKIAEVRPFNTATTENSGTASTTPDGSGDITVTHSLSSTPTKITLTASGTTFYHLQYHTVGGTTFKARVFDSTGSAVTTGTIAFTWVARI